MIAAIAKLAIGAGVPSRLARPVALILIVLLLASVVWIAIASIYRTGSDAGGSKVRVEVAEKRVEHIDQARTDERSALEVTQAIAARTARADAATDEQLRSTIEDLRNAIDAVPPAVAGTPLPAAPVGSLHEHLNEVIARANRSAGGPATEP